MRDRKRVQGWGQGREKERERELKKKFLPSRGLQASGAKRYGNT